MLGVLLLRWDQQRRSLDLYALGGPFYAGKGVFSWCSRSGVAFLLSGTVESYFASRTPTKVGGR